MEHEKSPVLRELAAADAFQRGRKARHEGRAPSLNEYADGTPASVDWLKGWQARDAEIAADDLRRQRAMKLCRYSHSEPRGACNCGGIGLCLDVA